MHPIKPYTYVSLIYAHLMRQINYRDWADYIFDIQDEISMAITENLKVELLGEERAAVVKRYTENLEAYDYYLQGNHYYDRSYAQQDWNIAINWTCYPS